MSEEQTDSDGNASTPEADTAIRQFPCASCGAKVDFTPGTESLTCPYCGAANQIPKSEADIHELDFDAVLSEAEGQEERQEILTVKCGACAAETTLPPNVTSATCPYCSANIVADSVSRRAIKPKSLLPFKIAQKPAFECFRKWIGGLWFAPNDLKRYARTEQKLTGLYVPFWTYDSRTISFYRGERGDDYYVTVGSGKNQRRERRTRWRSVSGTVWKNFDDILVLASRSLPRDYAEKLEPWDLNNLVPYQDEFLSGFRTENYSIDLKGGFARAKEIMYEAICEAIRRDIGGDRQRIHSVKTSHNNVTFKHVLLPVWMSAYRYREKIYRILINARTGEVQGERPWSWIKIALAVLAGLAVVGGIIALVAANKH
ncbi:MAG: hypothetical protein KIS92_01090 [Planctomycetota bacterium]|nr:hypothetical protein [Planctomycetota bacterium]